MIDEDMIGMATDLDGIIDRVEQGEVTDQDQAKLAAIVDALSAVLPEIAAMYDDLIGFPIFSEIFNDLDFAALVNEWLSDPNEWLPGLNGKPTYRTEPIPGAELGGQPRNPEADVIDEIDRLVDWQLEQGEL